MYYGKRGRQKDNDEINIGLGVPIDGHEIVMSFNEELSVLSNDNVQIM